MKVNILDGEGQEVEIGYMDFPCLDKEDTSSQRLFWIETKQESITIHMERSDIQRLINTLCFLKDNI